MVCDLPIVGLSWIESIIWGVWESLDAGDDVWDWDKEEVCLCFCCR